MDPDRGPSRIAQAAPAAGPPERERRTFDPGDPAARAPVVVVRDVHKRFGAVRALAGVSLSIPAGTVFGLLGENGAGKTTLINVLSTLLAPDSGEAWVGGDDVVRSAKAVRRRIGLAGQYAAVDAYQTGRENVEMVGRLYGLRRATAHRRTDEVLERFGLTDAADRPVAQYSGGMRRRLDLAASLVGRPQVVFLDEPTTGIDPVTRLDIWGLVTGLVDEGTTVLLTTQYLDEADELADRIGVLAAGALVAEGTSDELKDALGANTVRLRVADADADRTRRALTGFAPTEGRRPGELQIPARTGDHGVAEVIRCLDDQGIEPLEVALERPSLDDVFLTLTRAAREHVGSEQ